MEEVKAAVERQVKEAEERLVAHVENSWPKKEEDDALHSKSK